MIEKGACLALCVALIWTATVRSARRRGIDVGRLFSGWPVGIALGAAFAAAAGVPLHGAIALEGIAVAALVDARCGYVFDPLVVTSLVFCAAAAWVEGFGVGAIAGGAATGGALAAVRLATKGRGLGLGDVKLAALLGAGFGAAAGLAALGSAFVIGGALGGLLVALRKASLKTAVGFGPYLLAGILSVLSYHLFNTGVMEWP
jgi:leader peptidase (prepilin peptidase)/N-methyltransferase